MMSRLFSFLAVFLLIGSLRAEDLSPVRLANSRRFLQLRSQPEPARSLGLRKNHLRPIRPHSVGGQTAGLALPGFLAGPHLGQGRTAFSLERSRFVRIGTVCSRRRMERPMDYHRPAAV